MRRFRYPHRRRGRRALRAGVDHHRPGRRAGGHAVIRERFRRRRRRFGVVDLAQVAEDLHAFARAELVLEVREEIRVRDFVTAAVAEDRADEGEARDRVGEIDRRQSLAFGQRLLVAVDPFRPFFEVFEHLFAFRSFFKQRLLLRAHPSDRLRARLERAVVQQQFERAQPGDAQRRHICRPQTELQQQPPVLGCDPARAVHHVAASRPVDMRHVVAVAPDFDACATRELLRVTRFVGFLELLGDVVLFERAFEDFALQRGERVVQFGLVARERSRHEPAFLARREDLVRTTRQVGDRGARRRRRESRIQAAERHSERQAPERSRCSRAGKIPQRTPATPHDPLLVCPAVLSRQSHPPS